MKQRSRKDHIRTVLLWIVFGSFIGLFIGVAITLRVRTVPQDFDVVTVLEATLAFVVTALAIIGAFMAVITWNSIENRIRDGIIEYGEKANIATKVLEDKVEKVTKTIDEKIEEVNSQIKQSMDEIDRQLQGQEHKFQAEMSAVCSKVAAYRR
jgi:heme/copper-type cytochrome/quinol oxidase subunit 2